MEPIHVDLIAPDGRPFTARSAVQLANLLARGYRRVEAPAATPKPTEAPIVRLVQPSVDNDLPAA